MQTKVLILGMGYVGTALARVLVENCSVLGTYQTYNPHLVHPQFMAMPYSLGDKFPSQWADYSTWVCLLPPSSSDLYVSLLREWIQYAQQSNVNHVIYTSSSSVFGQQEGHYTEHDVVYPVTESAQKIAQVEQAFLNSQIEHITILRLAGLFDDERHPVYRLAKQVSLPNGSQYVNMVHREDVVNALRYAIKNPKGKLIRHIVNPHHPTRQDFYQAEAKRLNIGLADFQYTSRITGKVFATAYDDFPVPSIGM
ncbi:sugar nucleotide-binding protein [Pelistega sp. MC2]|uniref:sugar nucleotide-binding protein n=3 Tax=Pelistega TaxID=106146 RepID=UPI0008DA5A92|nr:sugar nucleotide-binding protein [Pelistega sp. MC2]